MVLLLNLRVTVLITKIVHYRMLMKIKEYKAKKEQQRYIAWLACESLGIQNPRPTLKTFVIERDGYKCSECGIVDWNNKLITLWSDHKNVDAL